MENRSIWNELREQRLPHDARERIMAACRAEAARKPRLHRRATGILIAAAMITTATLTAGAIGSATDWFGLRGKTQSHFIDDPDIVIPQPNAIATLDTDTDAPLELRCDAVTGGGNQLFLALTLTRTDGSDVVTVEAGETLLQIDFPDAVLTFADGATKKVYLTPLQNSTPACIHFEGSAVLSNSDLAQINETVTLSPGEPKLTLRMADGTIRTRTCDTPVRPMPLSLTYRNETLDCDMTPITIVREGVTITMTHIKLTNTELILSGSCDVPDGTQMPWLDTILDGAYLTLADGRVYTCGSKSGCGTMPDGSFILNWLPSETIDAAKVVSLTLDGQTVTFD